MTVRHACRPAEICIFSGTAKAVQTILVKKSANFMLLTGHYPCSPPRQAQQKQMLAASMLLHSQRSCADHMDQLSPALTLHPHPGLRLRCHPSCCPGSGQPPAAPAQLLDCSCSLEALIAGVQKGWAVAIAKGHHCW